MGNRTSRVPRDRHSLHNGLEPASGTIGLEVVSVNGDMILDRTASQFDAKKPVSSVVDKLRSVLGDYLYHLISPDGRLLDPNVVLCESRLADGDVITVVVAEKLELKLVLAKTRVLVADPCSFASPGQDTEIKVGGLWITKANGDSIRVQDRGAAGGGPGAVLLNEAKPGVDLEVTVEATGECGIDVCLIAPSEFSVATIHPQPSTAGPPIGVSLPGELAISCGACLFRPHAIEPIQLRIVEKGCELVELYNGTDLVGTAVRGCHWCVVGTGHDGDHGEPSIKMRLFQDRT